MDVISQLALLNCTELKHFQLGLLSPLGPGISVSCLYYNSSCIRQPSFMSHAIITSSVRRATHTSPSLLMHSQQATLDRAAEGNAPCVLCSLDAN